MELARLSLFFCSLLEVRSPICAFLVVSRCIGWGIGKNAGKYISDGMFGWSFWILELNLNIFWSTAQVRLDWKLPYLPHKPHDNLAFHHKSIARTFIRQTCSQFTRTWKLETISLVRKFMLWQTLRGVFRKTSRGRWIARVRQTVWPPEKKQKTSLAQRIHKKN